MKIKGDYYGQEANQRFMSVSQFKDFLDCEARALATVKGEYKKPRDVKALLVGSYVHSYFESGEAHKKFKQANYNELYKEPTVAELKKNLEENEVDFKGCKVKADYMELHEKEKVPMPETELYSDFIQAKKLIETVEKEPFFNFLWQGEKELVVTGELFNVDWKGKCDLVNVEKGYFVDLKTTRSLEAKVWTFDPKHDKNRYVDFKEAYGYIYQVVVYEHLLTEKYGKPFTGYLYLVTKEDVPNVEAVEFSKEIKEFYMDLIDEKIDHVMDVKQERVKPKGCGNCNWCKDGKTLEGFTYYDGW